MVAEHFTIALPSKGAIAEPTQQFFKDCGLKVSRPNPRQYVGIMPQIAALNVLFQRVKDVVFKVADGTAHLGVTGLDVVHEHPHDDLIVIHDELGYGHCELVVAVPESWVDVETLDDLVEVALQFRQEKGRNLRVATTFTHSTRAFFHQHDIHHFTIVQAEGAIEAAPTIGYADVIVDLTQTGTTLRENHLKTIRGGTILNSQACLVGNRPALETNPALLDAVRVLTEHMDAALQGRQYVQIIADVEGESAEAVAARFNEYSLTRGVLGPTVAPIYTANGEQWHTVTVVTHQKQLLATVERMRALGARHAIVTEVRYSFQKTSPTYDRLLAQLHPESA